MTKMSNINNTYYTNAVRKFSTAGTFDKDVIQECFDFAYKMTFGGKGKHADIAVYRTNGEKFANAFQGKLAEFALYQYFRNTADITKPDLETHDLGWWDNFDFIINGKMASVKSTKSYGNLLLLETSQWSSDGVYIPNNQEFDYHFLVRIDPFCETMMRSNKLLDTETADEKMLMNIITAQEWKYDIPGFITREQFRYFAKNGYIIPKGARLNHETTMKQSNYYVQTGDMNPITLFNL